LSIAAEDRIIIPQTEAEFKKAADAAIADIEKEYGKGAIQRLGQRVGQKVPCIPTGIPSVDNDVLGIGGFARGRVIEIYGPESGGKTTLLLRAIAEAQKAGGLAAFIDAEHAFSPNWAVKNEVNVYDLIVAQPDSGEEALEITERLIRSGAFTIIGVDSVAALVPKAELEGDMGDSHMGLQARLMSQALRKLTGIVNKSNTCLIFINQIREKIGVMFGSPETTTGGRALKFYSSVRLDVRRIGQIKDGDDIIGAKIRIKGAKNKLDSPFKEAEIDLLFDRGFDPVGNVLDVAAEREIVKRSGAWYSYRDERIGQGRANTVQFLIENPAIYDRIYKELNGTV
jgi:recombination protein RecA